MYRRPKFLEVLIDIRQQMAHEADYDVDLFTEMARSGSRKPGSGGRKARRRNSAEGPAGEAVPQLTRSGDA